MGRKSYVTAGCIKTRNGHMREIISKLDEMAGYRRIFIIGEIGTGKDTLAGLFHERSAEAKLPLKTVSCRDAVVDNVIINPHVVTYFDEIHTLGRGLQLRLIKELQKQPDAYIISSACSYIESMMERGKFCEELFYMLASVYIELPPLLYRREDIPTMVRDALSKYNKKYGKHVKIDSKALTPLTHYNYCGNINELYGIIERAVLTNRTGIIKSNSILTILDADSLSLVTMMNDTALSLRESMDRYERMLIINAINDTDSAEEAARLLDISRSSLYSKCSKHKIGVVDENYFKDNV